MNIPDYIEKKKLIHKNLLHFIENDDNIEENYQKVIKTIDDQKIREDMHEFKLFFYLLIKISKNHSRNPNFYDKIEQILKFLNKDIKNFFTNSEIFNICKNNKRILLSLIEENIMVIDQYISNIMTQYKYEEAKYLKYFFPEIKPFIDEALISTFSKELPDNFDEKRKNGENDSFVCQLIRDDSIEEFISYANQTNLPLSSQIKPSIFETNPFLIKHNSPTLIEYSVFFGSIQIFKYLYSNKVELTPSLWIYSIHGKNQEIINILEENQIEPINKSYLKCLKESVKCHHNDMIYYFQDNFIKNTSDLENNFTDNIIAYSFQYYNYSFLPNDDLNHHFIFYYLCKYDYYTLAKDFLKEKDIDINETIKNQIDIINLLFSQPKIKIGPQCFQKCKKLVDLKIPSTVTTIETEAFIDCSSLEHVFIPDSVTTIENDAFRNCSSLIDINFPTSITFIGESAFSGCSSLKEIEIPSSITSISSVCFSRCISISRVSIPSSVTSIGSVAFACLDSLTEIKIPSSVKSIGEYAFYACSSLIEITIPSSITSIEKSTFSRCTSLKQVTIPSSVTMIGGGAFQFCLSLVKITIPSSVKSMGDYVFYQCQSLEQISIQSPLTSIGTFSFAECKSLSQIAIPSSVSSFGESAFEGCCSLTQISIPTTLKTIERCAFKGCSALSQIDLPSSVDKIGDGAFNGCSSLSHFKIPSSIDRIGEFAFYECSSLNEITIPSNVTEIGNYAFGGCSSLTKILIPSSVMAIGSYAFAGCSSLTQISIPSTKTDIGQNAFPLYVKVKRI